MQFQTESWPKFRDLGGRKGSQPELDNIFLRLFRGNKQLR